MSNTSGARAPLSHHVQGPDAPRHAASPLDQGAAGRSRPVSETKSPEGRTSVPAVNSIRPSLAERLTTEQGVPISDDQNSLTVGDTRTGRCSRTSSCVRRSSTSTTSGSPSASCTPAGYGAHGFFETYESLADLTRPTSSSGRASRRRCSCASRPWPAARARSTSRATSGASR